jgi:hypothetical protein
VKITFWHSDKPRERILADAFRAGAQAHGDEVELRPLQPDIEVAQCDVAVMVGVKSRELFRAHWSVGIHTVMIDKGYVRHAAPGPVKLWEYWRTAVDAHHPTATLMKTPRPFDRIERLGLPTLKWRKEGKHIVIAGSSQKYHDFYGIKEPTKWTEKLVRNLDQIRVRDSGPTREIIYRPKPSWRDAVPVQGTRFSTGDETLVDILKDAHVMITHGSNACFEAVLLGVPCIVLGDGVAKPISSTSLDDIEKPLLCPPSMKAQWLANLAYCQWTQPEFASGEAWAILRPQLYG